jgi:hypothetical protein
VADKPLVVDNSLVAVKPLVVDNFSSSGQASRAGQASRGAISSTELTKSF